MSYVGRPNVLLVGDRARSQDAARRTLEGRGVAVRVAADLVEALAELTRQGADVLVVGAVHDDGAAEVVRRIRAAAGEAHVAVIALTGAGAADPLVAAGFDEIVPEAEPSVLARVIEAHLPKAESEVPQSGIAPSERFVEQLERQVLLGADLARRCALMSAELTILQRISDAIVRGERICAAVRDGLDACCAAGGAFLAILYELRGDRLVAVDVEDDGRSASDDGVATFFGAESLLREVMASKKAHGFRAASAGPRELAALRRVDATSSLIVPLVSGPELDAIGAVALFGRERPLDVDAEWLAFAAAVAKQVAQGLHLHRTFAAKELAVAEQAEWRALVEAAPSLLLRVDATGRVVRANRAPPGVPIDDWIGARLVEHAQPEDRGPLAAALASVATTGSAGSVETAGLGPEGARRSLSWALRRAEGGAVVLEARDVTEARANEARALAADRVTSLGTLAAAVAHEINSPLASVIANLDMLEEIASDRGQTSAWAGGGELVDARHAAGRIAAIVHDLEVYSQTDLEEHRTALDVEVVVEDALRVVGADVRGRARLTVDLRPTPRVLANPARLAKVLVAILRNAANAIARPDGAGATHDRPIRAHEIRVTAHTSDDGWAVVRVADSGAGIVARIQPLLFVPFVSSRGPGDGALGLAIAQRVITALGGRIEWSSEPERGNEIVILLPPAPRDEPIQPRLPGMSEAPPPMRARVLVVDDEPLIARAVARTLRDYDVVVHSDGHDVLALLARGERFDAIVCDLMMPAMTGMELFDRLVEVAPDQASRVIFLSGGAFTPQAREFLGRVKNARMDKPFETQALRELVRRRIESH